MNRFALLALALLSCVKPSPEAPQGSPLLVLERARARATPDPIRARLNLKLKSKPLDLSNGTNGALIIDRPGRGHLAMLGPLGGPVATLTSDGERLAVALPRERRLLVAPEAQAVLVESTDGQFDLDDLIGLLLGDLPFDEARVKSRRPQDDGTVAVVLVGPHGVRLDLVLDAEQATPVRAVAHHRTGRVLLTADFDPFEERDDGLLVPTRVALNVPSLLLDLELRYKSWEILDEVPPVFSTEAPGDDWSLEPLKPYLGLSP